MQRCHAVSRDGWWSGITCFEPRFMCDVFKFFISSLILGFPTSRNVPDVVLTFTAFLTFSWRFVQRLLVFSFLSFTTFSGTTQFIQVWFGWPQLFRLILQASKRIKLVPTKNSELQEFLSFRCSLFSLKIENKFVFVIVARCGWKTESTFETGVWLVQETSMV